ncbi:LOW QUALITY PROTEIN: hypothetical protein Cgig2_027980 [Carnegiea gigantea]|uniref:Uncharacterized protein n=1 Tax=Carnegiea gigantea TaxID=171969 RepID=A0A9Q1Q7U4_9CARY|nr:LOW QUALITY PROTEIN: hypothetical protein Cgig2_027980 [Carnegiea gigantea]
MGGQRARRRTTKSKQKHHKALGIRIFIMIAALSRPGLITLLARSHGLAVQRHSLLVIQAIIICVRVPTLDLGLIAILYVLDVRFEPSLQKAWGTKVTKSTRKKSVLSSRPRQYPCFSVLADFSSSASTLERVSSGRRLYLTVASSNLLYSVGDRRFAPIEGHRSSRGHGSASPGQRQTASTLPPSAPKQRPGKHPNPIR